MPFTLLLYQTENSDNLGMIARAASNFSFDDIVLVDPKCDVTAKSRYLAKHGLPTLEKMRKAEENIFDTFDVLVMTHGRESKEYNMVRAPITPRVLSEKLSSMDLRKRKIGLLFGPEGEGLTPEMLRRADIVVAIPTAKKNPSMNLAQSVTVMLYELSLLAGNTGKINDPFVPMTAKERDVILQLVDDCLNKMHWANLKRKETQRLVWRRMLGQSFLTKREAFTVMGFLKRVKGKK